MIEVFPVRMFCTFRLFLNFLAVFQTLPSHSSPTVPVKYVPVAREMRLGRFLQGKSAKFIF